MRQIMIVGYLTGYGAIYGAIAGGLASAIAGVFYAGIAFCVAIPFGIMGGVIVGFGAGFACGLVTLPFDTAKKGVTPKYRVSMAIAGMVLTSIFVIFIAKIYDSTLPVGLLISPAGAVLALLGALLAIPVSQKLVDDYHALITHFQQPSA